PEAPAPKPAPAAAPEQRWIRMRPIIATAMSTYRTLARVRIMTSSIAAASVRQRRCCDDGEEIAGDQGCTANQAAIDVGLRKQRRGVGGLDATAVQDRQRAGYLSIARGNFATQERMHLLRLLRRGGAPGTDCPHRLVGQD